MTIVEVARGVTGGVDTHLDVHVAAALDPLGTLLGSESFAPTPAGYKELLGWLESFGSVTKVGVEGTGSYGANLARFLRRGGIEVIEVDRPNRQARRRSGKSDPLDAVEAARAELSGRASGAAKSRDGSVEAIRVLVVAKRSARQARTKALVQMRHLGFSAPDELQGRLNGLSVSALVDQGAKLRPGRSADPVMAATKASIASLAHRIQSLDARSRSSTPCSHRSWPRRHPSCSPSSGSVTMSQRSSSLLPATIQSDCTQRRPGLTCAEWPRSRHLRARPRAVIDSTAAATAKPTLRSGTSSLPDWRGTPTPRPTSSAESKRDERNVKSSES